MATIHTTSVEVKQTKTNTKYIYKVDGKTIRTSTRKYSVSTADGSYFSSRIDLLMKSSCYQKDLQWARHRANLTMEQYEKEQKQVLDSWKKDIAKYSNENRKKEWVQKWITPLFRRVYTNEETEEKRKEAIQLWEGYLEDAKTEYKKQLSFMNNKDAMLEAYNAKRERGNTRLQALEIVIFSI